MKVTRPNFNRPMIKGLISAISETHREGTRQWSVLRALWMHQAITWEVFQWLEHLEIIMNRMSYESIKAGHHGCIPLPFAQGWDEVMKLTDESVAGAIRFEEIRKARGLQAAFDESRELPVPEFEVVTA